MINTGSSKNDSTSNVKTEADHFLELWDETNPQVSADYGVIHKDNGDEPNVATYEYFWTLGTVENYLI